MDGDILKDECKIDVKKAAISAGLVWGSGIFFAGLLGAITGNFAGDFINAMGSLYMGYEPTYVGSVIGGIWALIDGGIAGALFAYIYNKI